MIFSRRSARWLVPAALVAGTAGAIAVPSLVPAGADPVPVLPELTAEQLVQKVQQADVQAFSGDISYKVSLGLPDLGGLGAGVAAPSSILELLTGSKTAHVAIDGPDRQRVAIDGVQSETDWIHNGNDVWSWDSTGSAVKHVDLAAMAAAHGTDGTDGIDPTGGRHGDSTTSSTELPAMTPGAATSQVLTELSTSTDISVRTPGYVAGRPVYELVIAPKAAASTVADIVIDVDASTGMPLELRVEAKDGGAPAVQLGFTKISYDTPAASTFDFTPPPGATVTEAKSPAELLPFAQSFGGHRRHNDQGDAPTDGTAPATMPLGTDSSGADGAGMQATTVGTDWSTMAVISGAGTTVPPMLQAILKDAPTVSTAAGDAHLLHTRLVNVLLLPDGRIAIAALDPAAMAAALPA